MNKHNVQINDLFIFTMPSGGRFRSRVIYVDRDHVFIDTIVYDEIISLATDPISWSQFNTYIDNFEPVHVI